MRLSKIAVCLCFAACAPSALRAHSFGSPVCEVGVIPLAPMSTTLSSPAPTGWALFTTAKVYVRGAPIDVSVINTDPLKKARGVLIWSKFGDLSPAGSFLIGPGNAWQYIPPSPTVQCAQASISHTDNSPQVQADLTFSWTPPTSFPGDSSDVFLRAFIIEDCVAGSCRSYQALTQRLALPEAFLVAGFE
jgi:hypothetical protein